MNILKKYIEIEILSAIMKKVYVKGDNEMGKTKKFYYGWVVFAVCFLMVLVALGFGSSTKSTYLKAITENLGFERSLFTLNDSLRYITTAVLNFFFGAIVAKFGARKLVGFGFGFLIASFAIYSFATQLWQFYIGGVFLGAGLAWTTTTIVGVIVENWFTNGKGTLMGILLAANGLGGVISENIITRIVLSSATAWRTAYRITTLIFLITGVIVLLVLRNKPSDMGLTPLGQDKVKKAKRGLNWEGYEISTIYRKPYFYVSGFCVFIMGFILQSMSNVSKTHMLDCGITKEYIVLVFSVHSLFLAISKILSGFIYDKYGIRISMGLCCAFALISTLSLAFTTKDSTILPWCYSILSAFALPIETVMIPLLVSQMYGQKSFAKVMGFYLGANCLGFACGVPLANLFYDIMGTYKYILIILTIAMFIASIVAQLSIAKADRDRIEFLADGK